MCFWQDTMCVKRAADVVTRDGSTYSPVGFVTPLRKDRTRLVSSYVVHFVSHRRARQRVDVMMRRR